jgi:hypothetical protein
MSIALSGTVGRSHAAQASPANFGQLNSAIARGDLTAAGKALAALSESSAPAALAAKARGSLEALGAAIGSGDVDATKRSLADFKAGRTIEPASSTEPAPAPAQEPNPSGVLALVSTTEQIMALTSEPEARRKTSD